jgi:hypothetical protein
MAAVAPAERAKAPAAVAPRRAGWIEGGGEAGMTDLVTVRGGEPRAS